MFEYLSRIYLREKLPVYSMAIFLKKRQKPIPEEIRIEIFGEEFLKFRYKIIKLWEIDGNEILDNKEIELYPFIPLMKLKEPESAIKKASNILIENKKEDYFAILSVLTGLYYPELAKKLLKRRDLMLKSIVYDIIKKEGIEEGIEKGIEKGRREGTENAKIDDVLSVLETRFGIVPTKVEEGVKKIKGTKKLDYILKNAVLVKDLEDFQKILIKTEEVE